MRRFDVAVVGAGILGLAHAYVAARAGLKVAVVEQESRPRGPSVRNFGLLAFTSVRTPKARELALLSQSLWRQMLAEIGAWSRDNGSLLIIQGDDELQLAHASLDQAKGLGLRVKLISPEEVISHCPPVRKQNLRGGILSVENMLVDPAEVTQKLTDLLKKAYQVEFFGSTKVTGVGDGYIGNDSFTIQAGRVFLCTGTDFKTLFPDQYRKAGLGLLKLQMLRCRPRGPEWRIGPAVHGVFTLLRHTVASQTTPFPQVLERLRHDFPHFVRHGIHAVVSQMPNGDVIIGESHEELGDEPEVQRASIERMIQDCVEMFLNSDDLRVTDRWLSHSAKPIPGTVFRKEFAPGVTAVVVSGGLGLTLSLGVAKQSIESSPSLESLFLN